MTDWIPIDTLPPLDTPVWLSDPNTLTGPFIGARRSHNLYGCIWVHCVGDYWFKDGWKTSSWNHDADIHPTHWQPLPNPHQ